MDKDKEFKKFLTAYITQLSVIAVMVIVLVLSGQGILPSILKPIALGCIIIIVLWFNAFASKYRGK